MTSLAVAFFVTAVVASFVGLLLVAFGMVRKRQRFHEDWLVHLDQRVQDMESAERARKELTK